LDDVVDDICQALEPGALVLLRQVQFLEIHGLDPLPPWGRVAVPVDPDVVVVVVDGDVIGIDMPPPNVSATAAAAAVVDLVDGAETFPRAVNTVKWEEVDEEAAEAARFEAEAAWLEVRRCWLNRLNLCHKRMDIGA
jgi:hypothetical protein